MEPTQPRPQWVPDLFHGGKMAGAWRWPPTHPRAVCARSIAGISVSNPAGVIGVFRLCVCMCCQVEVLATGLSPIQRSPTEFSVSECNREASIVRRLWSTGGCCAMENLSLYITCNKRQYFRVHKKDTNLWNWYWPLILKGRSLRRNEWAIQCCSNF